MSGILMGLIQKKIDEREKVKKLKFFDGVLNRLSDERFRPKSSDAIGNPYSEFKTVAEKRLAYNRALENNAMAMIKFGKMIPLGSDGAQFNDVEYVAGVWRKQYDFPYETIKIQDKEFVLLNKLNRQEHTGFDFYSADSVCLNGMGKTCDFKPNYIVAKRETSHGTFYAYGCCVLGGTSEALSKARAHLTCKLFDEFQDIFEAAMQTSSQNQK